MLNRREMLTNSLSGLVGLIIKLSPSLSLTSSLFAQQEGTPLKLGRMSRREAQGRLPMIASKIKKRRNHNMQYTLDIITSIEEILQKCDDREMLYRANYLNAKVFKIYFYEHGSFDDLDKCLFQYPEQERKFGLVSKATAKIVKELAEDKKPKLIMTTKAYELYAKSPYFKQDIIESIITKGHLTGLLNQNIGGLSIGKAAEKIFRNDGLLFKVEGINQAEALTFYGENPRKGTIFPPSTSSYYALAHYNTLVLVNLNKNVPFPSEIKIHNIKKYFDKRETRANVNSFVKEQLRTFDPENVHLNLRKKGVITHLAEIYMVKNGGGYMDTKKVTELYTKPGMTTKDFLILGGVDPYNWVYPSQEELLDW